MSDRKVELKPETLALAKQIEKAITIDPKTGLGTSKSEIYAETLPEGITIDVIEKISAHNTSFAAASAYATGQAGAAFLKKHKDLDIVEVRFPTTGKDSFDTDYRRTVTTHNPRTKEAIVKHGVVGVKLNFYGTDSVGELKKVKLLLTEEGAKHFSD